ncbi:MAG: transglycosylase SLT domain-containing protein [Burkholderiaceae bacterium]|uniref:Transglycosylase SLT domain-containing protein n=1 Tax=Herminiimonas contaminans TaxID=1111140 RepID=A0ABS0ET71_9BURK|nr:transglycosylase SLT domain-containing protein [Herminiimonas contaminans]MBX9800050.1 transglycosylase SLT domain-containing protein [Burkholderiaceae bacterium]
MPYKTITAAVLLSFAGLSHASDLSLPPYNWVKDAALQDNPSLANDPLSEFVVTGEDDVWGRIRKGFGIPDLTDNQLVINQTIWYSSRPDYIGRTTKRASLYLYHVVEELEKRGMPTELALLPFIESAFNPQAYSTAKAAGMWQFIPSTGRDFNLKQNMFKDERRSVLASTDAALTYLQKLYGMFGDWQLALAAYNWGEGSVQRAIKKAEAAGVGTDFNSLSAYMPAETRNYVPKLQAVKNIIATPDAYGITLLKVDNQPYFVSIAKTRDIDVKLAAQLAELPMDEFKALNPQFNRPVITGSSNTQILLPQSNAEKFKANLAKWSHALSSWTAHKVTGARERIETIAAKFHTTPQVIREVNNIPPKMVLKAGSTVLVPRTDETAQKDITQEVADNATLAMAPDVPDTKRINVTVKKKDTINTLASRYKVTIAQIKSWNNLSHDKLASGQKLELHVPYKAAVASNNKSKAAPSKAVAKSTKQASRSPAKSSKAKTTVASNKSGNKAPAKINVASASGKINLK